MKQPNYFKVIDEKELSIAYLWMQFAGFVMPPGASEGQRQDMRKAFYAGFTECFRIMNDASEHFEENKAEQVLGRINDEGHEFFQQMMKEHGPQR